MDLFLGLFIPPYGLALIVGFVWALKRVMES